MPRIFYVNWFRRNDEGGFLWPGFGENSRVLKWVIDRMEGQAAAVETPIGHVPAPGSLDIDGLDVTEEDLEPGPRGRRRGVEGGDPADHRVVREVRRRPAGRALDRARRRSRPASASERVSRPISRRGPAPPRGAGPAVCRHDARHDTPDDGPERRALLAGAAGELFREVIAAGELDPRDPRFAEDHPEFPALSLLIELGLLREDAACRRLGRRRPGGRAVRRGGTAWAVRWSSCSTSQRRGPTPSARWRQTFRRTPTRRQPAHRDPWAAQHQPVPRRGRRRRGARAADRAAGGGAAGRRSWSRPSTATCAPSSAACSMRTLYQHTARRSRATREYVERTLERGAQGAHARRVLQPADRDRPPARGDPGRVAGRGAGDPRAQPGVLPRRHLRPLVGAGAGVRRARREPPRATSRPRCAS